MMTEQCRTCDSEDTEMILHDGDDGPYVFCSHDCLRLWATNNLDDPIYHCSVCGGDFRESEADSDAYGILCPDCKRVP